MNTTTTNANISNSSLFSVLPGRALIPAGIVAFGSFAWWGMDVLANRAAALSASSLYPTAAQMQFADSLQSLKLASTLFTLVFLTVVLVQLWIARSRAAEKDSRRVILNQKVRQISDFRVSQSASMAEKALEGSTEQINSLEDIRQELETFEKTLPATLSTATRGLQAFAQLDQATRDAGQNVLMASESADSLTQHTQKLQNTLAALESAALQKNTQAAQIATLAHEALTQVREEAEKLDILSANLQTASLKLKTTDACRSEALPAVQLMGRTAGSVNELIASVSSKFRTIWRAALRTAADADKIITSSEVIAQAVSRLEGPEMTASLNALTTIPAVERIPSSEKAADAEAELAVLPAEPKQISLN